MTLEKPLTPALITTLFTALLIVTAGFSFIFWWSPPVTQMPITPPLLWHYVWTDGFANRNGHCGIDLECRLSHFVTAVTYPPIGWRLALIAGAGALSAVIAFITLIEQVPLRETFRTIRGGQIRYDADARRSLRARLQRTGKPDECSLWLMPYVQLTPTAESYNIGLLGDHGSGKTGVLRGWAEQIIAHGERCILHDAKGDLTAGLPSKNFLLIAARDQRGWVWAIGRDIVNAQDAAEVAAKFVPAGSTGETVWTDSARIILAALIETLQHAHETDWGWQQLYEAVFQTPLQLRAALEKIQSPAALIIDIDENGVLSRTGQSILLTLWIAALSTIKPLVDAARTVPAERRFSIEEWLSPKSKLPKTIILQHAADYPILSTAISALLIEIVAGKILSPSMPNRSSPWLYLILDELPVLKRLDRLPTLLNVGREKGVRCIAATQDWEQIIKLYGKEDAATLEARFKIKVVCQLGISETRDRVVERFGGKRTIVEWDYAGEGKPRTRRESEIPVIQPHQLSDDLGVHRNGKRLDVRVAIFGLGPVAMVNIPFTAWPQRRRAHVPLSNKVPKRSSTNQGPATRSRLVDKPVAAD